jgi:hypothetical protein
MAASVNPVESPDEADLLSGRDVAFETDRDGA